MLFRLVAGAGLVALGYLIGRELKHFDPAKEELKRARESGEIESLNKSPKSSEGNDGNETG